MNYSETFIFAKIPQNKEELMALPEADLSSPYKTAALSLVALLMFEKDPETSFSMLDALRGPESLSVYGKSFIKERLLGKEYKVKSFFSGATVENGYEPTAPYTITVSDNPYSFNEENWAIVYVKSAGADSEREIKLRKKPSTGQWFLNDLLCLSDIRVPAAEDPWA